MIVSPGFIDPHSHSDRYIPLGPEVHSTIHQGITTLCVGNCGSSLAPIHPDRLELFNRLNSRAMPPDTELNITWRTFGEYLAAMDELGGCSSNVVPFVGFGTIRIATFGFEDRAPTPDELAQMKTYVEEAMNAGAFGLSTGLIYTPQVYSQTKEIIELTKVVAKHQGLYFSHIRGEGTTVVKAVKEFIEIVEKIRCDRGTNCTSQNYGKRVLGD